MECRSFKKLNANWCLAAVLMTLQFFTGSCSTEDPVEEQDPETALVNFKDMTLSVAENSSDPLVIELALSGALQQAGMVVISVNSVSTASSSDYSTSPGVFSDEIVLDLPKGATSASFSVSPVDNQIFNEDKIIEFNLISAEDGVELGSSGLSITVSITNDDQENPPGELLFNEDFDYGAEGDDLTAVSGWEIFSGSESPIQYDPEGLNFEGYASAVGGSATFEAGSGSREDLQRAFELQTSGTIYLTQIINLSSAEADENGDFFLALRDQGNGYFLRLYAKDSGSGTLNLGLVRNRAGSDPISFSTTEYSYNTNYLVVLKYDFVTEEAFMFVFDETVPTTEPTERDAISTTGKAPANLEEIVIRQGAAAISGTIDNIRIGTSWDVVIGL